MANPKPMTNKQRLVAECKQLGLDTKGKTVEQLEVARDDKLIDTAEEQAEARKAEEARREQAAAAGSEAEPPAEAISRSGRYRTLCNLRRAEGVIGPGEVVSLSRKDAASYIRQGAVEPA